MTATPSAAGITVIHATEAEVLILASALRNLATTCKQMATGKPEDNTADQIVGFSAARFTELATILEP